MAGVTANQASEDLQSGDAQKAVALYREALTNDPNNAHTYYNLALALDRLGDYSGEREALEKAMKLDASLAPVHNQLGFLDLQAGQTANAEDQFKTAISLDPQYAEAQNNLGVLYGRVGKNSEAEQLFRKATENNPQYGQAFANLGLILASESRYSEAVQALGSAVQLEPKPWRAERIRDGSGAPEPGQRGFALFSQGDGTGSEVTGSTFEPGNRFGGPVRLERRAGGIFRGCPS